MKDYLISCYIDDELDLDDKIEFVETVHENVSLKDEAVELLHQEKQIRSKVTDRVPAVTWREKRRFFLPLWRPAGIFAAGLVAALFFLFFLTPQQEQTMLTTHRFVLYQPDVNRVEITGSFLGWDVVPMEKSGTSGYWEAVLKLPAGEHRLCYILEGRLRISIPCEQTGMKDDFGGENSILAVNLKT